MISIAIGGFCILSAVIYSVYTHWKLQKRQKLIDRMVESAIAGSFTENTFDESRLSALETKLHEYLTSSELSAGQVARDKQRLKEFISDISHQTKTPVANLLLYSELLGEMELNDEARSCALSIQNQSLKLRSLIEDLVKLSRLETEVFVLNPSVQPLTALLRDMENQYLPSARAAGLDLVVEHTDAPALFDLKWTAEALGNVVDNAVKYSDKGVVTVSAEVYPMFTCIRVTDQGPGIPESEQSRIFTRFYRSETVRDRDGVGIGLYLARIILEEEGGYIKVSSEPGAGSAFELYLRNQ